MPPYIANYYNVSLDELIGMEEIRSTININELFPNVHQHRSLGQLDEAISILRNAMKIYPNNNGTLAELALKMFDDSEYDIELKKAVFKVLSVVYQKIINSPKRKYRNPGEIIAEGVDFDLDGDIGKKLD